MAHCNCQTARCRAGVRAQTGHGSEFDAGLSSAAHRAMRRTNQQWLLGSHTLCGETMMRNRLLLALTAIALWGCERPTAPTLQHNNRDVATTPSATSFSGEATVIQANVTPPLLSPIGVTLVPTGPVSPTGGALDETLLTLSISKDQTASLLALDAEVGHASTVAQGKQSRSQATVANVNLDVAGNAIQATFLQALATAVCDAAAGAIATGSAVVSDLVINGTPYGVGTQPNQTIVDIPALRVVANEQNTAANGTSSEITVNALHVTAYAVNVDGSRGAPLADVIIASAHADIHCGQCTDEGDNFTTGGGWITAGAPPAERKHFAVGGGYKNGLPWGHLTYSDKAVGLRIKGTAVISYVSAPTATGTLSTIEGKGEDQDGNPVEYTVHAADNGEPGDNDTFDITVKRVGAPDYVSAGTLGGGNIQFHGKPSKCS